MAKRNPSRFTLPVLILTFFIFHFPFSMTAAAAPTQEEVFRSIRENQNESIDGGKLLAVLAAAVGVAIVLTLFSRRQKREAIPKALNHQGKLMREMMKTAGLKNSEIRQLKSLADELAAAGEPLESPLTLMLCPSLIQKARQQPTLPR